MVVKHGDFTMVESKHHILKKSKVFLAKQSLVKTY